MTRIAGSLGPLLGASRLQTSFTAGLNLYAVAFVVGGVVVFALGTETKGLPLANTLEP